MTSQIKQATAVAHPNVALIKYWGKRDTDLNIPAVGSLSLTLAGLETRTRIRFDPGLKADQVLLDGRSDENAARRVSRCLDILREAAGVEHRAEVVSENDFPTGAGLASSASGFAALVRAAAAALSIEDMQLLNDVARIGSGSAPRSLHSGIVLLDLAAQSHSAIPCHTVCQPEEWPLAAVVAVTSRQKKAVGSTGGMESSRDTSPFYKGWVDSHPQDLEAGLGAVKARDFQRLAELSESSCLKMHAVAMSTQPPLVYWTAATMACMRRVRDLRAAGVPVFFTIDAGPQLKAVCLPEAVSQVHAALEDTEGVLDVIDCSLGTGAWAEPNA